MSDSIYISYDTLGFEPCAICWFQRWISMWISPAREPRSLAGRLTSGTTTHLLCEQSSLLTLPFTTNCVLLLYKTKLYETHVFFPPMVVSGHYQVPKTKHNAIRYNTPARALPPDHSCSVFNTSIVELQQLAPGEVISTSFSVSSKYCP